MGLPHFADINLSQYTVDSRYLEVEGTSEILRDIRTSTYQMCRTEENTIKQPNFINEHVI